MITDSIKRAVAQITGSPGQEVNLDIPPSSELGDFSISLHRLARERGCAPAGLAQSVASALAAISGVSSAQPIDGYVNIRLDYAQLFEPVRIALGGGDFGRLEFGAGRRVMVEYFSPNTNKPLHIGHLRNLFTGEAVANLLSFSGFQVIRANLYNDRGIHISKAQLAYNKWGEGLTPPNTGKKGDHFVGEYYVLFNSKAEQTSDLEEEAQSILRKWEAADPDTRATWKIMRDWVIEGMRESLEHFGIKPFDVVYWESEFWEKGVEVVKEGIKQGLFKESTDGAVIVELPNFGSKPILRADGTALYITQDLYLAVRKVTDYGPLAKSIYVVAAEQADHFKALFQIIRALGYTWAENCYHLGYGMILIKGGKLKSREGITADADQMVELLENMAYKEIKGRNPDLPEAEKKERARRIALSALKWDFLKIGTWKNINFDPQTSLSLKGDTGPYLLYTYARTRALLRRSPHNDTSFVSEPPAQVLNVERDLATILHFFPSVIARVAQSYGFSSLCAYLYNLAEKFNHYYQTTRILETPPDILVHRLALAVAVGNVLKSGLNLLGIETLEEL